MQKHRATYANSSLHKRMNQIVYRHIAVPQSDGKKAHYAHKQPKTNLPEPKAIAGILFDGCLYVSKNIRGHDDYPNLTFKN